MSNISTFIAIQEQVADSFVSDETIHDAMIMFKELGVLPTSDNLQSFAKFAASYSADISTRIVSVLMTKEEIHNMVLEVTELENLS